MNYCPIMTVYNSPPISMKGILVYFLLVFSMTMLVFCCSKDLMFMRIYSIIKHSYNTELGFVANEQQIHI